ncbi:phage antirepressor N-terminal domain-containing protein [Enterobacter hormaechei]|uniref:phage antirepressor N-terminal domain-containing protein n=1 Tax=Enterobacter hormaechei TaxID=158836 RepID=UPI003C2BB7E8
MKPINVNFHGAELLVIEHNGEPYTPMKPIVEGMGLDWMGQLTKLKNRFAKGVEEISIPTAGGQQRMICLPLRKLAAWLNSISANKVKPEIRDRVLQYQQECDDVLYDYWTKGVAVNPRKHQTFEPAPVPALTTSAADTIAAGVALLDGTRKLLHISDSSVLAGLRKLQSAAGLPDLLPGYAVDAPPSATGGSSEPTSSLRQLLAEHGVTLSPQKAYARLAELGIVEQKTRTSTRGEKHYWCLTAKGLEYGKNLTSPGNPRATQPHFYNASFAKLLGKLTY